MNILCDTEAYRLMRDPDFERSWNALYEACPWATPFQRFDFVATWYDIYREHYSPVILVEREPGGAPTFLLPLALSTLRKQLVVAGTHHAEYQVWLADPSRDDSVVAGAFAELFARYPAKKLVFTYLPPATPLDWARSGNCHCSLTAFRRPLLMLNDSRKISASLHKSHNRTLFNKLKRIGDVRFEHFADADAFAPLFDAFSVYKDLRQGALADSYPFQGDPRKRAFHLALMKLPRFAFATVIRAGDAAISSTMGVYGRDRAVHHYFMSYHPRYAKLSPMTIHFFMLANHLMEQGATALDLTPGGDRWKERFATDHDEVHMATIFPDRGASMRFEAGRRLRASAKRALGLVGVRPQSMRAALSVLRHGRPADADEAGRERSFAHAARLAYVIDAGSAPQETPVRPLSRDLVGELLQYRPAGAGESRQSFMARAEWHLKRGDHVYTYVMNGRLAFCGWLMERADEVPRPHQKPDAATAVCLLASHVDASIDGDGFLRSALLQMLADALLIPRTRHVIALARARDERIERALEGLGFSKAREEVRT